MSRSRIFIGFPVKSRGFTLLELLVVLVIISLMSALIVPSLAGSLSGMNLKTNAKKISAALRYAQSRAVSEKVTCEAWFDFDKNKVSIIAVAGLKDEAGRDHSDKDMEKTEKPKTYFLPDGIRLEKGVSSSIEVDSGLFRILFLPAGGSSGGEVILVNERGKKYKVSVDFITGGVKLANNY